MLRQESSRIDPEQNGLPPLADSQNGATYEDVSSSGSIDIQVELERLKDIIFASLRLPFIRYTLIEEEQLLDQIELVQYHLPKAFDEARQIVERQDEIILEAQQYAEELILAAQRQAAEILDDMELVRQARLEAQKIRQQVQEECEYVTEETFAEIDRLKSLAQEEVEELRRSAIQEAQAIQDGADQYADGVLGDIEQRLSEMMRVIRNGRQQLNSSATGRSSSNSNAPSRNPPVNRPSERPH